jgi:hypothetical protein
VTRWIVLLVVGLTVVYLANGDLLPGDDALASSYLPVNVMKGGGLTFTAWRVPRLFNWDVDREGRPVRASGHVFSIIPSRIAGEYVNTFGLGAGLTALPVLGAVHAADPPLEDHPGRLLHAAKLAAALSVAASAAFVFLIALGWLGDRRKALLIAVVYGPGGPSLASLGRPDGARRRRDSDPPPGDPRGPLFGGAGRPPTQPPQGRQLPPSPRDRTVVEGSDRWKALLVAIVYGLGTSAWSMSSQTLWQHGPNALFVTMGLWLLVRSKGEGDLVNPALAGLALSFAVLCRPTSVFFLAAGGVHLLVTNRRGLAAFAAAAAPLVLFQGTFNARHLGSPFTFPQGVSGLEVALEKTGRADLWQTPPWVGVPGLLVSPARGLFFYSPFLLFALPGIVLVWRRREYAALRPFTVAILAILAVESRHFDWWGGWSYGYRRLVDTAPILVLCLVPVLGAVLRRRAAAAVFLALVLWAVYAQFLGAFAYDVIGWNNRGERDVDSPEYRHRLWSVVDNPVFYYTTHFAGSRRMKHVLANLWVMQGKPPVR